MFLALRDLRFAKGRFALMGGVVALITLLLVMLSGLTAGLADQSTSALRTLGAPADSADGAAGSDGPALPAGDRTAVEPRLVDRIVFGAAGTGEPSASFTESQISADQVEAWSRRPGVDRAEPLGISQTRLQAVADGIGGTRGTDGAGAPGGGTANVAVFGVERDGGLAPLPVDDGTVVLGAGVAEDLSLKPGDRVSVGGTELAVAGVVQDRWYSHTSVVWTTLPTWAKVARPADPGQLATVAAVTYGEGAEVDDAAADAAAGTVSETRTGSFRALGSFTSENGSLMLMQAFLYGISALVIVAFLTVWTVQRTRDVAVLKALGASGGYVLRDALTQAAVVLLAGATAGGTLGLLGGYLAAQAAPFLVDPGTTLLPVAGIVALGLVGSALAVVRVTKVDPLIALGGN